MQCSCGGSTVEHKVQRNLKIVGWFDRCTSCGRIHWIKKPADHVLKLERGKGSNVSADDVKGILS